MQTAMLTGASCAYTIKYFHTQCWDLRGVGSRRSFTTRWRTSCFSPALQQEDPSERSLDRCRLHNHRGHLAGQVQRHQHLRHCHRHPHRRWRWFDALRSAIDLSLFDRAWAPVAGKCVPRTKKAFLHKGNINTRTNWIVGTAATNVNT